MGHARIDHDDHHHHDHGLAVDLERLIRQTADRRRALRWLVAGGAASGGLLPLAGCGGGGDAGSTAAAATTTTGGGTATTGSGAATTGGTAAGTATTTPASSSTGCSVIPEETAGPYPADGSNSSGGGIANALALSGIVRSDIRSSIAGASGVAAGVPLTVEITLVDTTSSCALLGGYAVYLWHCDALGRYSMYSAGVTGENYLRGVQTSDAGGVVSFTTIFPGCYSGRMPHLHFEVYRSATTAGSWTNKLKTSQMALPVAASQAVYATSGYSGSAGNLARIGFATDNVFSDGVTAQLAAVTGDAASGYTATLQVGIAV